MKRGKKKLRCEKYLLDMNKILKEDGTISSTKLHKAVGISRSSLDKYFIRDWDKDVMRLRGEED